MSYGDTIVIKVDDKDLHLTYNANTFLIYKRFFCTDLMGDILKIARGNGKIPQEIQAKINSGELTVDKLDSIDFNDMSAFNIDSSFILQIVIAMASTYERSLGKRRSVDEIANDIPATIFNDADFLQQFTDILTVGLKKTH